MDRNKCARCALINLRSDQNCRRCGASLVATVANEPSDAPRRSVLRRLIWIASTTFVILFAWYLSLLVSSEGLSLERRKILEDAILVLDGKGFGKEAFVLRNLVTYRGTDNWWNRYVGHHDAYAATNFPFEIVTLYPEFFDKTIDETERAAILLHEANHLFGSGEDSTLERVWRDKQHIGWTADKYGTTSEAWNNTRQLTRNRVPELFRCGSDGQSDCVP